MTKSRFLGSISSLGALSCWEGRWLFEGSFKATAASFRNENVHDSAGTDLDSLSQGPAPPPSLLPTPLGMHLGFWSMHLTPSIAECSRRDTHHHLARWPVSFTQLRSVCRAECSKLRGLHAYRKMQFSAQGLLFTPSLEMSLVACIAPPEPKQR